MLGSRKSLRCMLHCLAPSRALLVEFMLEALDPKRVRVMRYSGYTCHCTEKRAVLGIPRVDGRKFTDMSYQRMKHCKPVYDFKHPGAPSARAALCAAHNLSEPCLVLGDAESLFFFQVRMIPKRQSQAFIDSNSGRST